MKKILAATALGLVLAVAARAAMPNVVIYGVPQPAGEYYEGQSDPFSYPYAVGRFRLTGGILHAEVDTPLISQPAAAFVNGPSPHDGPNPHRLFDLGSPVFSTNVSFFGPLAPVPAVVSPPSQPAEDGYTFTADLVLSRREIAELRDGQLSVEVVRGTAPGVEIHFKIRKALEAYPTISFTAELTGADATPPNDNPVTGTASLLLNEYTGPMPNAPVGLPPLVNDTGIAWSFGGSGPVGGPTSIISLDNTLTGVTSPAVVPASFGASPTPIDTNLMDFSCNIVLSQDFLENHPALPGSAGVQAQSCLPGDATIEGPANGSNRVLLTIPPVFITNAPTGLGTPVSVVYSGFLFITHAQMQDLVAGRWMLNIGPSTNGPCWQPIRGQIQAADTDGDGVPDYLDLYPGTPPGSIVNAQGGSIDQIVPCDATWGNHAEFVERIRDVTQDFERARLITRAQMRAIITAAEQSDCGKFAPGEPHRVGD